MANEEDCDDSPAFCQACLTTQKNGFLKDMTKHYNINGEDVMYSKMMQSCFSLELGFNNSDKTDGVHFICDVCIEKLRDAVKFKSQVENAQRKIALRLEILAMLAESDEDLDASSMGDPSVDNNDDSDYMPSDDDYFMDKVPPKEPQKCTESEYIKMKICSRLGYTDLPYELEYDQVQCMECNLIFDTNLLLRRHMPIHYANFICEICGQVFTNTAQWTRHQGMHARKVECTLCPKKFKWRDGLRMHMIRVHGSKKSGYQYRCYLCLKVFETSQLKQNHILKDHKNERPILKCDLCEKTFTLASRRLRHLRRHLKQYRFFCDTCNAGFYDEKSLSNHISTHTGIKNFTCKLCDKKFVTKQSVLRHHKTHTGEKDHSCHVCNISYRHKVTLVKHLLTHEQDTVKES